MTETVPPEMRRSTWTAKDVARKTGVSIRTVYMWLERGDLGFKQVGRRKLIPVQEYDRFIDEYQPATKT